MLDTLFSHQMTHLTGEAGAGKSLLLLCRVGRQYLANGYRTLWIDADNNFAPARARSLFGDSAPAVLSAIRVARPASLLELKQVAAQLASRDLPPCVRYVVLDSASRLPRLSLSQDARAPGDVGFVARDFFAGVIEPLMFATSRDQAQLYLTHQNSQSFPFWWDYYPARESRIHLALVDGNKGTREIQDGIGKVVGILHLAREEITITEPVPKKRAKVVLPQGRMFRTHNG